MMANDGSGNMPVWRCPHSIVWRLLKANPTNYDHCYSFLNLNLLKSLFDYGTILLDKVTVFSFFIRNDRDNNSLKRFRKEKTMLKGQNHSGIGRFPIRPVQVTRWSSEKNCKNRDVECYFCGISKKEVIIGSLIEVFLKNENYPVTLIEKIKCANIEDNIPEIIKEEAKKHPERFVRWLDFNTNGQNLNTSDPISVLFVNYDGNGYSVYHSYVLTKFYSGWNPSNACYKRREDKKGYDECMQSDLKNAKEVFNTKVEKPYECNLTENPLMEIAYPILAEDNSCIAVMIIGQIPKKEFNNNKQLLIDLRNNVHEFGEVIQEQIKLKNKAFLSEFLESLIKLPIEESQLRKELEEKESNKNKLSIAQHVFLPDLKILAALKQVSSICDDVLFYYNPEANPIYCHILEASNGTKPLFNIKTRIIKTKQEAVQELNLPIIVENTDTDSVDEHNGFVHLFYNIDSPSNYVGILLRWNDYRFYSYELKESIKGFVHSLGTLIHDALMTHVSTNKQRMLSDLVQTLNHDLNQKIEIVENHTISTEKKIKMFNADPMVNSVFSDYAKDVRHLTHQLRFFVEETRAKANNVPVPFKSILFAPYGQYLFNLNEYYTMRAAKNLRAFYSPSVTEVCSVHPDRYPDMKADPALMERCTNNLLSNAEKYAFPYTNIFLDCYYDREEDQQHYTLRVTNFGKQIPGDFMSHIYEYGQTGPNNKGKGIGLAVVKEICEMHNGFVECESRIISDYNIPLLFRVIQETNGDKQQFESRFPTTCIDYNELMDEYDRLLHESAEGTNYVAKQKLLSTLLSEVCARGIRPQVNLTKRYLEASLKRPTARITFIVKIPFN